MVAQRSPTSALNNDSAFVSGAQPSGQRSIGDQQAQSRPAALDVGCGVPDVLGCLEEFRDTRLAVALQTSGLGEPLEQALAQIEWGGERFGVRDPAAGHHTDVGERSAVVNVDDLHGCAPPGDSMLRNLTVPTCRECVTVRTERTLARPSCSRNNLISANPIRSATFVRATSAGAGNSC